jgi:hypothetical protein
MSNNILWIKDASTGEELLLAKSYGAGWCLCPNLATLGDWLQWHDARGPCGETTMLHLVDDTGPITRPSLEPVALARIKSDRDLLLRVARSGVYESGLRDVLDRLAADGIILLGEYERAEALRRGIAFIASGGQPCTPDTLRRLLEGDAL